MCFGGAVVREARTPVCTRCVQRASMWRAARPVSTGRFVGARYGGGGVAAGFTDVDMPGDMPWPWVHLRALRRLTHIPRLDRCGFMRQSVACGVRNRAQERCGAVRLADRACAAVCMTMYGDVQCAYALNLQECVRARSKCQRALLHRAIKPRPTYNTHARLERHVKPK